MRRSRAAIVGAALLKKEVAQSRQRVRHKLGLFLLRHPQDDVYKALRESLRAWHHTPLSQLDLPWRARKVQR